jgi:hypothetical protein
VAKIPHEVYQSLSPQDLRDLINDALKSRVFIIFERAFLSLTCDMDEWMSQRGKNRVQLSGRDKKSELSVQISEYLSDMQGYQEDTSAWNGALGTFTCKNETLFADDLKILQEHETWRDFLPWGEDSPLSDILETSFSLSLSHSYSSLSFNIFSLTLLISISISERHDGR